MIEETEVGLSTRVERPSRARYVPVRDRAGALVDMVPQQEQAQRQAELDARSKQEAPTEPLPLPKVPRPRVQELDLSELLGAAPEKAVEPKKTGPITGVLLTLATIGAVALLIYTLLFGSVFGTREKIETAPGMLAQPTLTAPSAVGATSAPTAPPTTVPVSRLIIAYWSPDGPALPDPIDTATITKVLGVRGTFVHVQLQGDGEVWVIKEKWDPQGSWAEAVASARDESVRPTRAPLPDAPAAPVVPVVPAGAAQVCVPNYTATVDGVVIATTKICGANNDEVIANGSAWAAGVVEQYNADRMATAAATITPPTATATRGTVCVFPDSTPDCSVAATAAAKAQP